MPAVLHYRVISRIVSNLLLFNSSGLLICAGIAWWHDESADPFILSSAITWVLGLVFSILSKGESNYDVLSKRDACFTVSLTWLIIGILGAFPYILSGTIPRFTDAVFESISGFTTTGASVITNVEILPKSVLFWRSLTHWIGGYGIILIVVIILPSLKIGSYQLFTSESSFTEKIKPRVREVGHQLLFFYILLTAVETILLMLGKMDLFDSVCHAFGTVATGGFSTKNTSIGYYSPYIQYVVLIFMILSGTNYIVYYHLFRGNFKKILSNEELRTYFSLIFLLGTTVTLILLWKNGHNFELTFRESFFQVVSIITTTGFSTSDYLTWPTSGWFILFFAMFLGGCTGSTSGGIKIARHVIMIKSIRTIYKKIFHPQAVLPVRLNKSVIGTFESNHALTFVILYLLTFAMGTTAMIFLGCDLESSAGAVATCLGGIGPGLGVVGPASTYAYLGDLEKIVLMIMMLLGRLEIFTVMVLFTKSFWNP